MLALQDIEAAARVVYQQFQATPQYRWALSSKRLGTDCWIKHENHTPVGAFKIRGGLTYFDALKLRGALPREVISATRGNHGQSMGWAARVHGVACRVPDQAAVDTLAPHIDHIVQVSDEEVAQAMRDIYTDTHNVAEGAGAASFAAAMQERAALQGKVVGTTLCGGNVDASVFAKVLAGC